LVIIKGNISNCRHSIIVNKKADTFTAINSWRQKLVAYMLGQKIVSYRVTKLEQMPKQA